MARSNSARRSAPAYALRSATKASMAISPRIRAAAILCVPSTTSRRDRHTIDGNRPGRAAYSAATLSSTPQGQSMSASLSVVLR